MRFYAEPVVGNSFFARKDILESLLKSASDIREGYRHNIAIVGKGLIGKSSLLLHFLNHISSYDKLLPLYVNLKEANLERFIDNRGASSSFKLHDIASFQPVSCLPGSLESKESAANDRPGPNTRS